MTDEEIIDGIEDIANEAANYPAGVIPGADPKVTIQGLIKGIRTILAVDPARGQVVTGYPIGVARNP